VGGGVDAAVGVRLHDLRHTYASFGTGDGLGLPIIGRLLGHTQAATTARYAHLDNDLLRRAFGRIAKAMGEPVVKRRRSPNLMALKREVARRG
jgi:integrase